MNISQKLGSKGPVERSVKKKNMEPIKIDPELSRAYQLHEQDTRNHLRIHHESDAKEGKKQTRGGI